MVATNLLGKVLLASASYSLLTQPLFRVIATLIAGLLGFGRMLYLSVFLYTFLSTAFFLVSSVCHCPIVDFGLNVLSTCSCGHYDQWCFQTRLRRLRR